MREERKKIWIHEFQTRLLMRIGLYWLLFFITLMNLLFVWRLLNEGPGDLLEQYVRFLADTAPALICLAVLMPVLAWDAVKFSHRLLGPLYRFRKTVQSIADGESVRPIKLRKADYLGEFRDDFNRMLESLQKQGVSVLKPNDPTEAERSQSA